MATTSTSKKAARGKGGDIAPPVLDFELPPELEAREPAEARGLTRDGVRLLVTNIGSGRVRHLRFREIGDALEAGDVLVVNTSGTLNAALEALAPDGTPLELHLSTQLAADRWVVELRTRAASGTTPYFGARPGDRISLPGGGFAEIASPCRRDPVAPPRLWYAALRLPEPLPAYLDRYGFPIRYGYVEARWDIAYYQTAFAVEPGSAEMPSAGRAFTPELITRLVAHGVQVVPLLLHTGVSSLEAHEAPYAEFYRLPEDSARRINEARAARRRIIAVGTTVVRALETSTDAAGVTHAGEGWTERIVSPTTGARSVDGLLTGLHEPRASHLWMLEAIAGRAHLEVAYGAALGGRYLWHEFGDLHLILP